MTQIFKENSNHSIKKFPISTQSRTRNAHNAFFLVLVHFFFFLSFFLAEWYVPCTSLVPCHRSEGGRTETTPNTIDTTTHDCGDRYGRWRLTVDAPGRCCCFFRVVSALLSCFVLANWVVEDLGGWQNLFGWSLLREFGWPALYYTWIHLYIWNELFQITAKIIKIVANDWKVH